jgi:type IV secretion system protein VirB9
MKMNNDSASFARNAFKGAMLLAGLLSFGMLTEMAHAEAVPHGSRYDARMQQVVYNPRNVSVVNTSAGFVTTLIFADDEAVSSAEAGFPAAWEVTKEANRVKVRARPIEQGAPGADGNTEKVVIPPNSHDWRTNLLVVTNKRIYSLDLNVLDDNSRMKPAYVVMFRYPQDEANKTSQEQLKQQLALMKQAEEARTEKALEISQIPRNWDYSMRVGAGSRRITPDFAWDDGRFTFLGFSPQKDIPSLFELNGGKEQIVNSSVQRKGSYTVLVVHDLTPKLILRSGNAVVGIDNNGYGKVKAADGTTVSPNVERVEAFNDN